MTYKTQAADFKQTINQAQADPRSVAGRERPAAKNIVETNWSLLSLSCETNSRLNRIILSFPTRCPSPVETEN